MLVCIFLIYLIPVILGHILWMQNYKDINYFMTTWLFPCWLIIGSIYVAKTIWRSLVNGFKQFWNELVKAIRS
jgi:hypothetical protein